MGMDRGQRSVPGGSPFQMGAISRGRPMNNPQGLGARLAANATTGANYSSAD